MTWLGWGNNSKIVEVFTTGLLNVVDGVRRACSKQHWHLCCVVCKLEVIPLLISALYICSYYITSWNRERLIQGCCGKPSSAHYQSIAILAIFFILYLQHHGTSSRCWGTEGTVAGLRTTAVMLSRRVWNKYDSVDVWASYLVCLKNHSLLTVY